MIATWTISGIIGLYSVFVIYKKVRDIKNGKFCGCGCNNCLSTGNCKKNERD